MKFCAAKSVATARAIVTAGDLTFERWSVEALKRDGSPVPGCVAFQLTQGEFKNRRKRRSRRGNEAEVFSAPKSASSRRRLPSLNTPCQLKSNCNPRLK